MSLRLISLVGLLSAAVGAAGLWLIIWALGLPPTRPALTVFFVLLGLTAGGLAVPLAAYLNHRFAPGAWTRYDRWRILRQAGETAAFIVLCAWLQKERMFSWPIGAVTLAVFVLMEVFFLTRHKD